MRILHVVPSYLPAWRHGGPIWAVHGLASALAARGHRVSVFTTDVHGRGTLDVPRGRPVPLDGLEVSYFPVRFPRRLYRSPELARALAREVGGFDLLHLHSLFLWPTAAAARAAERAGLPYLVAPRGMLVRDLVRRRGRLRKNLWLRLVERRTLSRAAGLHATSALEASEAARFGFPLPPVYVVPNGIDPGEFSRPPGEPLSPRVERALARRPFFLSLGRVSWKKGLDRLVRALPGIPEAPLVVAGNDDEGLWPRLERLASGCGVGGRVVYLGAVEGADKTALLREAAALVLASRGENFGNVVLEAMAAGTAVVVTPEVGLASEVEEAGCGLVVEGDPEALAPALAFLLAQGERRREMGQRGAARVRQRFAWPEVARRMEEAYASALAGPRGRAPQGGQG